MFLKKLALAALLGASAMAAVSGEAEARDRHHRHSYHHRDYDRWDDRRDYRRSKSEEHTSELQSLMRISYAVFCLKKKKKQHRNKKIKKETQTHNDVSEHY